jgi:hypothetical protein
MSDAAAIQERFHDCLDASDARVEPYRHWLLDEVFPDGVCEAIRALPVDPPRIGDTMGKRETHNSTRGFFSAEWRQRFEVCGAVAEALQAPAAVAKVARTCGLELAGSSLRIEYCQDTGDFWLEPHTDIGAKLFTMLVYLSDDPGAEKWGTDIYDGDKRHLGSAPYGPNLGLIFIPGHDTWHGFRKRPIEGVRRSIIINYVKPEWRSRHELAYPDRPVG